MIEQITKFLNESNADGWSVTDEIREGWEFYFIRHKLDQNRVRNTENITLTVYNKFDGGKYLGSATAQLPPSATDSETRALIASLVKEAKLVKNPPYELAQPEGDASQENENASQNIRDIARDFILAMSSLPETESEDINSYEIFTDIVTKRIVTSTGIDVTSVYPSSMIEVVINARKGGREIELYRMYRSGTCDAKSLKSEISRILNYGRDKLAAVSTPPLEKADVVFSTDAALRIYRYFIDRMSAGYVFQKMSDFKIGQSVAGAPVPDNAADSSAGSAETGSAQGDKLTVRALKYLKNSSDNAIYDDEGRKRRDMTIIENGIAVHYWGSSQFSSYLGVEDSFIIGNFEVSGGAKSAGELRRGDYLEIVEFSDFQVSPVSGDIAGEIRLAYLHQGGDISIVQGGSISGNMRELAWSMRMSKEQKQYNNSLIPSVTRLYGVNITGAYQA